MKNKLINKFNMKAIKSFYTPLFFSIVCVLIMDTAPVFGGINIDTLSYDTTLIYNAMAKARRGENITIGVIGGSITAGSIASSESKRWANLVEKWWSDKFSGYGGTVSLVNAGIGGTGSDVGVFRVKDDLLVHNPDFIVVEFSVNDAEGVYATKMMEGVIRQILEYPTHPAVMMLLLKQYDGTTAAESHKLVGIHYNVPIVSFADLIDAAVASDGRTLISIYADQVIHPNDIGMQYIADFINEELDTIYAHLPLSDDSIPAIDTILPAPLITDLYDHTFQYNATNLVPVTTDGWVLSGTTAWSSVTPNSEITFEVDGNAVALIYSRHNNTERGMAEAWVDDGPHVVLNSYWTQNWGPARIFQLVDENIPDGIHTLHIKVLEEHDPLSTGNLFQVLNVMKAGNIGNAAPIAVIQINEKKILTGTEINLNGTESFDPDGDDIVSYAWSIDAAPAGNTATINNSSSDLASITPDAEGIYKIGFVVNDGNNNSVKRYAYIHAVETNTKPIAYAGEDKLISTKKYISLNGHGSSDADGDSLTFKWTLISEPEGSSINILPNDLPDATFGSRIEGDYFIALVVNDSLEDSDPDTIKYTAIDGYTGIQSTLNGANFQCFPNPTSGEITLKYVLSQNSNVKIDLVSLDGKLLTELINEIELAGKQYKTFNLNNYRSKSNSILLRIIINNNEHTEKILLN